MDNQPDLGRLLSVRMRVHPTWYLAVILITSILVTQYPGNYALWERVLMGLVASLLFLASMAVVQILTNLVSILARIPVRNATLFIFGGVAQVPEDSTSAGRETVTAIVTLLLNLMVAAAFNWLYLSQSRTSSSPIMLLLQWLTFFWYMLVLFHIVPAFPLAGGRVLAAGVWKVTNSYLRSMRLATTIGWCFGVGLSLGGAALLFLHGQIEDGLMLMFFGWALQGAATFSIRRATLFGALQSTRAKNIMTREFPSIGPDLNLEELVRDYVLMTGQDFFAVTDQGKLLGVVTTQNIKHVPKNRWGKTSVGMIMIPGRTVRTVSGEQSAAHALDEMDQFRIDRLPVLENGEMIGIVVRDNVYRLAEIRAQLKI
ncbi:MAG: CBS domain-containing protein [Chloroflexi bacterium]|nr:CBS domain-containing protein [Chloroflexota bacterium]